MAPPVYPYPLIPHFAVPFKFSASGVSVVEQDSSDDLTGCVNNIIVCPKGFRTDLPDFGIPDPLFQTVPINTTAIQQSIAHYEPRATIAIYETGDPNQPSARTIEIDVQATQ